MTRAKSDRMSIKEYREATRTGFGIRPTSKHRNVKIAVDGEKFDSKWEYTCYMDLKLREKAGEIRGLRRQVKFSLFMPGGEHYGVYKADFVYEELPGPDIPSDQQWWKRVISDAKSEHTAKLPAWQKVKKLMLACHGIEVIEILKHTREPK